MADFQMVLSTCAEQETAARIAHHLVEQRLAACVNILPGVRSIYRWKGSVEQEPEVLMLIKTSAALVQQVESALTSLHPYETPEFLVLPLAGGSKAYLAWLEESLG